MKLKMEFDVANAAFRHEDGSLNHLAVAEQVEEVAKIVANTEEPRVIRDLNGNPIGKVWYE